MENPYLLIQSENALENKTLVEKSPLKIYKDSGWSIVDGDIQEMWNLLISSTYFFGPKYPHQMI